MPSVHVDKIGEMAIIECAGRFVRTETAVKLRDAVTSQTDAHVVVLDLTEMHAIGVAVWACWCSCRDGLMTTAFDSNCLTRACLCETS
jgi:hypothetical protein